MRFRIRRARARDAAAVKGIEESALLAPWTEADYSAETSRKGSVFLVAEDIQNNFIIGYVLMRLITKTNAPTSEDKPVITTELLNLAIAPSLKRKGIATWLLQAALHDIPESSNCTVFLEVRVSNHPAIAFYKQSGFHTSGVRPNFYANPTEDAVLMEGQRDKMLARNLPDEVVFEL